MHEDDRDFYYSSDTEWDNAEAYQLGALYPERAWISTDRDVWHANPYYTGEPMPHPEDDGFYEAADQHPEGYEGALRDYRAAEKERRANPAPLPPLFDDEIPF